VVVSSRAALRAYGEQEFPVEPLLVPDSRTHPSLETVSQYEAVKLFIERAMAAKPDFHATNENAPAIAGICERVDGLPLALEQAEAVGGPAEEVGVDVVTGLDQLADQSLLRRVPDVDEPRLLMLQTIREFAGERLEESGEAQLIRDRHAEAFAAMAQAAEGRL